ncbi:hypothetical protein [Microbacterium sp. SS28]|uniref:hypothetical protein n=1 Tax=Microbacterium sp. SS28 TaxID=2919948 RepID=UPI001FAB1561|nr:hypothetical protein [Microbacterium sp. SS28]
MTSTFRTFAAASAAALLLTLAACSSTPTASDPTADTTPSPASGDCAGVTIVVDASVLELDDDPSQKACVETDEAIVAADALAELGVTTEGTDEYGDQVVCRVDGVPAEDYALTAEDGSDYFEKCESMPAAFAYWSLWVQPEGGEWEYAQEGLSTQQLQPGESLALLFSLNGEPAAPTS